MPGQASSQRRGCACAAPQCSMPDKRSASGGGPGGTVGGCRSNVTAGETGSPRRIGPPIQRRQWGGLPRWSISQAEKAGQTSRWVRERLSVQPLPDAVRARASARARCAWPFQVWHTCFSVHLRRYPLGFWTLRYSQLILVRVTTNVGRARRLQVHSQSISAREYCQSQLILAHECH